MGGGMRSSMSSLLGFFLFGREDANRNKIHFAPRLDVSKLRFIYPSNKRGSVGTTSDLLPFYTYLNYLFRRRMTPREEDSFNIPSYNWNLIVDMAPRPHRFDFCVFDFIWEEIKAISKSPLKNCGYAPYIIHMIERVTAHTFGCDKEHHEILHHLELLEGDKSPSPIGKIFRLLFGICRSQHAIEVKAQHERRARRKDTKSVKEIHAHLNLQPPRSPIALEGEESLEIEFFEERIARFDVETSVQQWYGDASFSSFDFDYSGTTGASSSHPPLFDSPPPAHTHGDEGEESSKQDEDDE
jgi:hypothetical protein